MSPVAVPAPAGKAMLTRDFTASIVVFLVAMPLCMGIAVASGVPPERGLITGIIGGIIVGALAGSPLQVSGPAAGLAVLVFELVQEHGLAALAPILMLAGVIQVVAGLLRIGGWFRAISPAVVHGMLAGIGLLIVAGQFHVMFDSSPLPSGLQNLAAMPAALVGLSMFDVAQAEFAFVVGIATLLAMIGWEKFRPAALRLVPGALIGVVVGTLVAIGLDLPVARVTVPESIAGALAVPGMADLARLADPSIIITAIAIAFIASAETLLSAAAVDRMHNGAKTNYNKELWAQGVGNFLCGGVGALPMTGVIVRSSANVQAGATSRASAIMHGIWILGFVALLPGLLQQIPMAALAAVLVVTGWRLVSLHHARHLLKHYGVLPALVWLVTLVSIVAFDLLTGVIVGLAVSLLELVPHFNRLSFRVDRVERDEEIEVSMDGVASFPRLPRIISTLDSIPSHRPAVLNLQDVRYLDHTCSEMLGEWIRKRRHEGSPVTVLGADRFALAS